MKNRLNNWRIFSWVAALVLPALSNIVFPYFLGRGVIPYGLKFELLAATLVFALLLSAGVMFCARMGFWKRLLLFLVTFVVQMALMFLATPPQATTEMIGFAARFGSEFKTAELEAAAIDLLKRDRAGTIQRKSGAPHSKTVFGETDAVDDSMLPNNLRGHFRSVSLPKNEPGKVIFEVGPEYGLFFSEEAEVDDFWHRKVGGKIYAYRYMRP
jgi:hypothetical protein